jgi:beta-N-acetylhexosaminidase
MEGAAASGPPSVRAVKAKEAGCNVLLICNHREAAQEIVDTVRNNKWTLLSLTDMKAQRSIAGDLYQSAQWLEHIGIASDLLPTIQ